MKTGYNEQHGRIINVITNLMLLFIPISLIVNYLNARESFAILYFFFFFAALKHYFCFKKEQDTAKASEQILIILFGLYFAFFLIGEQNTFDVLWGLSIPFVAVMSTSLQRLKTWLYRTVALTILMIFVAYFYPQYVRYELFPLFSLLWALIFISYMAYRYKEIQDQLQRKILSHQDELEEEVEKAVQEIKNLNQHLEETQDEILDKLGLVSEYNSNEAKGHSSRIAQYSRVLATLSGLNEEDIKLIEKSAPLHDIGQIGISESIISKPGRLTTEEYERMKEHTSIGENILGGSDKKILQVASEIAGAHHEKYDGSGYPKGLIGQDIPLSARIVTIVDVFDALYSDNLYKSTWSNEDIINFYKNQKGKQFDPQLTELFLDNIELFIKIYDESILLEV